VQPRQFVRVQDYYLAFDTSDTTAEREPTEEEYNQLVNLTTIFLDEFFTDFYDGNPDVTFLGLELEIDFTAFEDDIPEEVDERYNIFIDFSFADLAFTLDSTPPPASELFSILRTALVESEDYIRNVPRAFENSPFETTTALRYEASESIEEIP